MSSKNKGPKLWSKAKKIIPGGSMLFSKKAELWLPDRWPTYFKKSKDINIWDLNDNRYKDFLFAVGTNILGYSNEEIDDEVKKTISLGNISTLNSYEEVDLANELIEINNWSHMVRFARTGGEANSIAVRIARAATNKTNIAVCGYHGWHDWYIAANISSSNNLDGHLMSGLKSNGVPKNLSETIFTFKYGFIDELENLIINKSIGIIKMEVARTKKIDITFLKNIRKICNKHNIILIFDECTSGFRQTLGGLYKVCDVEPDMVMFGKALGNGYPITAVVGKKDIMSCAEQTFISSTFWTERLGSVAALKSLEVMKRIKSWEIISSTGRYIKDQWKNIADKNELEVVIEGIDAIPSINFISKKNLEYKTLIAQEMLKEGYLASNMIFVSIGHTKKLVDEYIENLNLIFKKIKECEEGRDVNKILEVPVCQAGFKRFN
ncbi:MAG: aminotransferase class III [Pelagibacteraceae bacterium]|nr:aminotransferase class III [Pelagibacteraceae bacterium]|tara:strand:+ start:70463 stop:71773 length:1311 start_codon:yes stop_codon:yes gene_type:complete